MGSMETRGYGECNDVPGYLGEYPLDPKQDDDWQDVQAEHHAHKVGMGETGDTASK